VRLAACLLLLALSACAQKPAPMYSYWHPAPAAQSGGLAYTPDRIDGSYQGTVYLTSTPNLTRGHWWRAPKIDDEVCPHTTYGIIEIGDHVMTYAYAPNLIFSVPVTQDGAFSQTIGTARLIGKVHDGRLTFNLYTPLCTSRFFGDFKLNHG
jgi:hypothetical protein